jgi:holliday junction DNA helicase RuvA
MIGYLHGELVHLDSDHVILLTNGIGYEVSLTPSSISDLQLLGSKPVSLWIYTHVREDAMQLFGFVTRAEKDFFVQLLKVNGIGPKSALTILAGAPLSQIQSWIDAGDAKALSLLPKIGKKTAEQIVLSLKGKLVKIEVAAGAARGKPQRSAHLRQVASALVNLGYKPQFVDSFIETLPENSSVEDGIRAGLQKLSGQI